MRTQTRLTISRLIAGALLLAAMAIPAWAQGGNPPASTTESGQTSGRGQTAVEQTPQPSQPGAEKGGKAGAAKESTLTGCLGGPNEKGAYTLTGAKGKKPVEVGGEGVDLKSEVGHQVKLTGSWVKTGTEIGEKERAEASHPKGVKHFKANKLDKISDTCTTGS